MRESANYSVARRNTGGAARVEQHIRPASAGLFFLGTFFARQPCTDHGDALSERKMTTTTTLRGITRMIRHIHCSGGLDLRWSQSELRTPSITHGPRGSFLSFSLSPITEDTVGDLSAAHRYNIPVRLVSLSRPLNLVIVRLERHGEEVQITGRIVPRPALE